MSEYVTDDELAQIKETSSDDLLAQLRETLELAVDTFNHRGDFAALDELGRRLHEELDKGATS